MLPSFLYLYYLKTVGFLSKLKEMKTTNVLRILNDTVLYDRYSRMVYLYNESGVYVCTIYLLFTPCKVVWWLKTSILRYPMFKKVFSFFFQRGLSVCLALVVSLFDWRLSFAVHVGQTDFSQIWYYVNMFRTPGHFSITQNLGVSTIREKIHNYDLSKSARSVLNKFTQE